MIYSQKVLDRCQNPQNVGMLDENASNVGTSVVGAASCGDVIKLQIMVVDDTIVDAKFKTFGCGAAIAASQLITEMIIGRKLDQVCEITDKQLVDYLELPPVKVHCSVLAEEAIAAAIDDYLSKNRSDNND